MRNIVCNSLWAIIICCGTSSLSAQEFGDVSIEEVAELVHPKYPDAKAAYLAKSCIIDYDLEGRSNEMRVQYFYRIKIYDEAGIKEFADWNKYLYRNGNDKEYIKNVEAKVYNIVDGELQTTKLEKSDIYKEEESDSRTMVRFALPNVQVGSVIDLKYKIYSPFLYSTPKHYFQADIPVKHSEFIIYVPKYFSMTPVASGAIGLERIEEYLSSREELKTSFVAKDVHPILEDDYVLNINDYKSSLKYELESIQWPNQLVRKFSESWEKIGEKLEEHSSFGKVLDDGIKDSKELIKEAKTLAPSDALVLIYEYVRSNIAWNEDYGIYADQKPSKVWESRLGSVPDINLLLVNLLRKADITAYPLVTKYRSRGLLNEYYPSLSELNYVLVQAEVDGQPILLDATAKYSPAGELPLRANNLCGLLVKKSGGKIVPIGNNKKASIKKIAKVSVDSEQMSLQSAGTLKLSGYAATRSRLKSAEKEDSEDRQNLTSGEENDTDEDDESEEVVVRENVVNNLSVEGFDDPYSSIITKFESTLYKPIQAIGNELFIDAFVIADFEENPFKDEKREYPAFFNCAHDHMYVSVLDIPDGYVANQIPEDLNLVMESGKGSFLYVTTADAEKISIRCLLEINEKTFMPEDYDMIRRFMDAILDKQKEKIILKKI